MAKLERIVVAVSQRSGKLRYFTAKQTKRQEDPDRRAERVARMARRLGRG